MFDDIVAMLEDPGILVLLMFTFLSAALAGHRRSGRVLELLLFIILVALQRYEGEVVESPSAIDV